MKPPRRRQFSIAAAVACTLAMCGCQSRKNATATAASTTAQASPGALAPPAGLGLQAVTLPDFSGMEPPVRRQMESQSVSLTAAVANHASTRADLAIAYGEMAKLLMAASFFDAAEICYSNAQTLVPTDPRWPYYLGHVYKAKGPPAKSIASFERAWHVRPDDVPTMIWLGEAYLADGRTDEADRLFAQALDHQPALPAALFGAGRVALAKRDYRRAVDQLTQALKLAPQATRVHYSLGMAYRGLGDLTAAETQLSQQGDVDPKPIDPLMDDVNQLLESPEAYNLRGGAEMAAGRWAAAAAQFRKGLELAPKDPSLGHRLATALYQMGDTTGAIAQFEQVLQTSPDYSQSQFSLAILLRDAGRYREAIEHFSAALKSEPDYLQARVELAGVLARTGRPADALEEYAKVLASAPTNSDASFGRAMTLVRLRRYADARDAFADGMKAHPDQPMFGHALARLLAAAPDDRVRDGHRALAIVDQLIKGQPSIELAETTAMALAELGRYQEAAAVQRDALTAATNGHLANVERRIAGNLRLYEAARPCRTPFAEDELSDQ